LPRSLNVPEKGWKNHSINTFLMEALEVAPFKQRE